MLYLVTQLCSTLWAPMNCSSPGSSLHGILQARILEGLPCPSPGDLPNPGSSLGLLGLIAGRLFTKCRQILYQLSYQGSSQIYQCMNACSVAQLCLTLYESMGPHKLQFARFLCPWDYPSKNTIVSCHFLFQGIILIHGLNWHHLCLMYCEWILYHCATREAPYISVITLNVN